MLTSIPVPEGTETVLTVAAAVCGASTALVLASVIVWTVRDISSRSRDMLIRIGGVLLVLLVPIVGLIAYLLLRPRETIAERYERELIEEILARELSGVS